MAIQLAADRGARVVATASPANHDYLRELGAVPSATEMTWPPVRGAAPQGVDVAVDTAGTDEAVDVAGAGRRPEQDRDHRRVRTRLKLG